MGVAELRRTLEARGLAPRKSLGQNFLIDGNLIDKLIDASGAEAGDLVLEIGPGAGALTERLLDRGLEVIACELDNGLADLVADRFDSYSEQFRLIRGDCLASKREMNPAIVDAIGERPYRLIANLPYGAATPLIMTLLLQHHQCESLWVTIQKEVADRLLASPGGRDYGELSIVAQSIASVQRIASVSPSCFWPAPKVVSAMVGLVRRNAPLSADPVALQLLARRLFMRRRKQLQSILKGELPAATWPPDVDPTARPESLSIEQLESLRIAMAAGDG